MWRELGSPNAITTTTASPATSENAADQDVESTPFTGTSMAGSRGLGVERVFWNEKEKELVAVVWFGSALAGWPGVVHGGGIATVLGDKMALAAGLLRDEAAEKDRAEIKRLEPTELELVYKKPTYANAFYVVRVVPRFAADDGLGTVVKSLGKEIRFEGKLETLQGITCVETKAVVPIAEERSSGIQIAKEAVKGGSWFGGLR